MLARSKFVAILLLVVFPPLQATENSLLISLNAVAKPFNERALSYPNQTGETYMRGIEYLINDTDKEESKPGRKQYPLFPTYQTKLSIKSSSDYHRLSQRNTTDHMNEEQKSVMAIVDINSPVVWMQGTAPLSLASYYGNGMNSSCQLSDHPR
jgi:hypothetical protein